MTEQPKAKYEIIPEFYKRYPDYDTWTTAKDFERLDESGLRSALGSIAFKSVQSGTYIPNSFVERYGENASYELTRVLLQEANRRGVPEILAKGVLNGGMHHTFNIPFSEEIKLDMPLITVHQSPAKERQPGDHSLPRLPISHATPPQLLSYETSQTLVGVAEQNEINRKAGTYTPVTTTDVNVPRRAIEAIVRDNPDIIPQSVGDKPIFFPVRDEAAYMSGYATRSGAHRNYEPITTEYNAANTCGWLKAGEIALNPNKPDVDVALAWTAGYIQADVDHMTDAQRNAVAVCPPPATPTSSIANGNNGASTAPKQGGGGSAVAAPSAKGR